MYERAGIVRALGSNFKESGGEGGRPLCFRRGWAGAGGRGEGYILCPLVRDVLGCFEFLLEG